MLAEAQAATTAGSEATPAITPALVAACRWHRGLASASVPRTRNPALRFKARQCLTF